MGKGSISWDQESVSRVLHWNWSRVIKVSTVKRFGTKDESWNNDMFMGFKGTPWEPVPGREGVEVKASLEWAKQPEDPKPVVEPEEKSLVRRRL